MTFIIINTIGILFVVVIIYWFWVAKPNYANNTSGKNNGNVTLTILVEDGVYKPNLIKVKENQTLNLNFIRKDHTPCAEWVIFDKLNISEELAIDVIKSVKLKSLPKGIVEFRCQMNMYKGKIEVE